MSENKRVKFDGGAHELSEPYTFIGKTGDTVKMEAAVIVCGIRPKGVRVPVEAVEALFLLKDNKDYKEFAKKHLQK